MLTRRYYRSRDLQDVRSFLVEGRSCVTADYELRGTRLHLVALMAPMRDLPAALAAVGRTAADDRGARRRCSSTSTCPGRTAPPTPTRWRRELRGMLAGLAPLPSVRRVTVTVCTPGGDVDTVTFRPSAPTGSPRTGSSAACTR